MRTGTDLIKEERIRQLMEEGFTYEHDNQWLNDELVLAAACYLLIGTAKDSQASAIYRSWWPWHDKYWKPMDKKRNLVRAGALIAAELDRMRLNED